MAPLRESCSRVGPSRRLSTMPKRPSRVNSSNTSGAGGAGGEDGAGHARLVPADPPRDTGLEQLHDLTGRPGVDVRVGAFADLLPEGSPHRPCSSRAMPTYCSV